MTPSIQVYQINTPQELGESGLSTLAAKSGQRLAPPYPVYGVWVDGEVKAAFHVRKQAILYPALHLTPITPREFYRMATHVLPHFHAAHPDGLVLSDMEYPEGTITPEKLAKVGLTPFNHRVYQYEL